MTTACAGYDDGQVERQWFLMTAVQWLALISATVGVAGILLAAALHKR